MDRKFSIEPCPEWWGGKGAMRPTFLLAAILAVFGIHPGAARGDPIDPEVLPDVVRTGNTLELYATTNEGVPITGAGWSIAVTWQHRDGEDPWNPPDEHLLAVVYDPAWSTGLPPRLRVDHVVDANTGGITFVELHLGAFGYTGDPLPILHLATLEFEGIPEWPGLSAEGPWFVVSVPEPATAILVGAGVLGLIGLGRRRRAN